MSTFSVNDLVGMPRVTAAVASPDGTWFAVEVQGLDDAGAKYVPRLFRVTSDGTALPLFEGPFGSKAPCFRQDGALGFLCNRDPNDEANQAPEDDARWQVWVLEPGADTPIRLTDEPLGVSEFRFARHADRLVLLTSVLPDVPHDEQRAVQDDRKKNGPSALHYKTTPVRFWDHWLKPEFPHLVAYDARGANRKDLTPTATDEHRRATWDVSEDGRWAVITATRQSRVRMDESRLLVVDLDSGATTTVFDQDCDLVAAPIFSPDSHRILFGHARFAENTPIRERLFVVNRDGTGLTELAPQWERFAEPVGFHPDGRAVVSADDDAHHRLFAIDLHSHEVRPICDTPLTVGAVRRGPTGWTGVLHGMLQAPEAFLLPFEQTSPTTLTKIAGPHGDLTSLATVESLTVDSKDGTPIQYWLLVPVSAIGPAKTLVWIHGGPMGAFNDGWHWRWNVGVPLAQGYAMVLPNPRGSTGFGQRFIEEIWGNRYGAECFDDVMAVTEAVSADPRIDGTCMAAMGGSFGGYMTNWIGGNTDDRFRCLVTHASLYDFPRFYGVTDHPGFWALKMGLAPWDDPDQFSKYSPHTRVQSWKSPTLVIHGERDYRVPVGEGLALFEALQANRVESELLAYPDENHWILKPRNIVVWYETFLTFVAKHMKQTR